MHCVFSGVGHCCVHAQSKSGQVQAHKRNKIVHEESTIKDIGSFTWRTFYCWPAFTPEQQQGQKVVMCTRVQYGRQFTSNLVNWKHLKEYSQIHMLTLWSLMLTSPGSRLWSPGSPSNLTNIWCSQCYTFTMMQSSAFFLFFFFFLSISFGEPRHPLWGKPSN